MTHVAFHEVLETLPTLSSNRLGLGTDWHGQLLAERQAEWREYRASLLQEEGLFTQVCAWLAPIGKRVTVNPRAGSYGLKHLAEAILGTYVPNGVLIAAAVACGFRYHQWPGSPNACFNMCGPDLRRLSAQAPHAEWNYR